MPCILTRCRAFVLPGHNTARYKRLQRILCSQCNYTTHAKKQRTGLYSGFSCDCARSIAHDTRPTQQAITPPMPRWRAYTRQDALNRYQILPPRRCTVQVSIAAYYNNVYKRVQGRALSWIHARRYSISQTMPARRGLDTSNARRLEVWHRVSSQPGRDGILAPSTRRGSPAAGERRAARNHWRLPPQLFSGCRPIANKGKQ